jgi:hypothetical protein
MKPSKRRLREYIANAMGVRADNKLVWAPGVPIIYMDNPKSGSTTIKHSLKQAQAAEYVRSGVAFRRSDNPHKADDCLKTRGLLRRSAYDDRLLISCVRNPYTRALSGFLDKVPAARNSKYFPELRGRRIETFEDHVRAIAEFRPRWLNFHFRPQHLNLDFPSLRYDAIFYLEHLSAFSGFFGDVVPGLRLETNAPHSQSALARLREHYTQGAVELVRHIYAEDFARFGYSTDLKDAGATPGECILGNRIVPEGERISGMAALPPRRAPRSRTFEATVRFHQLVSMLML